jgi:peptide/nickel transport system permease protein
MATNASPVSIAEAGRRMRKESAFAGVMRRLRKNKTAMLGLYIFLFEIVVAMLSRWIIPYGFETMDLKNMLASPSLKHFFGTDELGRDVFSRILYGTQYSLSIGVSAVLVAIFAGVAIGSVAGYMGGAVDNIIMRILDIIQAIPGLLLTIAISAVLGSGFDKAILALGIGNIPGYARLLRASMMNIRKMEYLEAAEVINCSHWRIITRHLLPNSIAPLIVQATMGVASAILTAASLSFIGLGVRPPTPEWGAMLAAGRGYIRDYPHLVIFPGVCIMITVLALNILGDGLRDALDPKLKI